MRKALKISAIVIGSLLVIVLLVAFWLTTPSGENFVRQRVVAFLGKKLKTEVYIGSLDYKLPKMVELKDVYFKDQRKDTLLAARRMRVDINMLKLLSNKVEINEIQIDGALAKLYRLAPDTSFNFDYIVKAFAAPPSPQTQDAPTDSTGQVQLDIKRLMLHDVLVSYDDYTGGDRFYFDIDTFNATVSKVDPYSMDYRIDTLFADGLRASFSMDTSYLPQKKKDTTSPLPLLSANELNLRHVAFRFQNNNDELFFDLNIGKLYGHPKQIDLNGQKIAVKDIRLDTTSVVLSMGAKAVQQAEALVDNAPPASEKWIISADSLNLGMVSFTMNDKSKPRIPYGIDYAHMDIQDATLNATQVNYTTDTIAGLIHHLSAKERTGQLDVQELRTAFMYHPQGVYLKNLYLKTSRSEIKDYAAIAYPSLEALANNPQSLQLNLNFKNSIVGIQDVLIFAPQLRAMPLFAKYANDRASLNTVITGYLNALNIKTLQLQGFGGSYVDVNGTLNGLPDPNALAFNLNINRLQSNEAVIAGFLPAATLKQIDLPSTFSATGKLSGNMRNINTNLVANTSDGAVTIKGQLVMGTKKGGERYDLVVKTNKLNIGKIIKRKDILGTISANVSAKGSSFDVNYMNAMLRGDIQYASFMGYGYRSIQFSAKVANKKADVNLVSNDPNAKLKADGIVGFAGKYPSIVAKLDVAQANLQALNLSKDDVQFSGFVDANVPVLNPDYPEGAVQIDRPTLVLNGQRYVLDSLYVTSHPNADSGNYIVVSADAIQAVLSGHTPLTKIGSIVQSHISRHYSTNREDSIRAVRAAPSSYDLRLAATITNRPLIRALVPGITYIETTKVDAYLTPATLAFNASVPALRYNDMVFENANASVTGDNNALNYNVTLDKFTQGNSLEFWYASAKGNVAGQAITSRVSIADRQKREQFGFGVVYHQHPDKQELHVDDGLVLNYKTWQVSQPNAIVFSPDGFYAQNFRISNGSESIAINSTAPQFSAPMTIAINNFLASNITQIVSKDTLLVNGIINGNITLSEWRTNPKMNGTLQVNNLSVLNDTVGDVTAQLNSASANAVDARIAINGRGNDVVINGYYYPKPVNGNNFDMVLRINTLNVQTIEGVAMHQIKNSTGAIRGDLKITGTIAKPIVQGELHTDNLTTTIAAVGARYNMPAESLTFKPGVVELHNFKLVDDNGNSATVDGRIITENLNNLGLQLRVRANRFLALNTTSADNQLFYGRLLVSTNMRLSGTVMAPEMDGNLTVHDSTKLTVVMPEKQVVYEDREGIVEFVDKARNGGLYVLTTPTDTVPRIAFRAGSYMNVNVTVEKEAEFSIVVDQGTGDFLRVRGEAALNTVINPDGTMGIAGVYTLNSGAYELNYNFIKRRFDIQPGSTITFAGDPLEAQIDLKAIYVANVPPYELVERQVSDPAQLVYYKQRLPFEVQLKLQGQLMRPEINFDVVLPERGYGLTGDITALVQARLAQLRNSQSDMNKQVFAVLLLNRFVSENPFESGTGIDAGFVARQSVTRFISEQLNRFASELIQGVDLTLDLQATEDYTTGQRRTRTDLNVSASKRLLNDRLTLTLGSNFDLEGQNSNRNGNTSVIPGNIAADYELSQSGRYKVRIYRQTQNEDVIRGYVSETGGSFIFSADYNRFRNLFINRRRRVRKMRDSVEQRQTIPAPQRITVRK